MTRSLFLLALPFLSMTATAAELPPTVPALPTAASVVTAETTPNSSAAFDVAFGDEPLSSVTVFGTITKATLKTATPTFVKDFVNGLRAGGWQIVVEPTQSHPATARYYERYSERWLELRPGANGSVELLFADYSFPGDKLVFNEGESFEKMQAKFKGLFEVEPPSSAILTPRDIEDFAFLRHFPGFELRDDLTKKSDSLKLKYVRNAANDISDELLLKGPTVTKSYRARVATSSFKQFMAYRLALQNAGWKLVDNDVDYVSDHPWLLLKYEMPDRTIWSRLEFDSYTERFTVVDVKK